MHSRDFVVQIPRLRPQSSLSLFRLSSDPQSPLLPSRRRAENPNPLPLFQASSSADALSPSSSAERDPLSRRSAPTALGETISPSISADALSPSISAEPKPSRLNQRFDIIGTASFGDAARVNNILHMQRDFNERSTLWTTSKNIVTRRTFVCSREGFREKKKGAREVKSPRPETRIGCQACMTIRLTPNGRYRVTEFEPNHNHQLATVSTINMLRAKKMRRKARAVRADLVDDSVRTPEFETEDEAYEFYSMYAGRIGFTVRRASMTLSAESVITRRMFVCSREGFRENKKGSKRVKKPRPETRTGCPACMIIRVMPNGKYHVSEFVTRHNHQLATPSSADLIMSHSAETSALDDELGQVDLLSDEKDRDNQDVNLLSDENKLYPRPLKTMRSGDVGAIMHCGEVGTISEYKVTIEERIKDHFVKFDSLDLTATCTCKMFDFIGIQCRHVLKVLDARNIKDLPPHYILKRWRKDAKTGGISSNCCIPIGDDPQSSLSKRYGNLCRIFSIAAARAAKTMDSCTFVENQSDLLIDQVEQVLRTRALELPPLITSSSDRPQNPIDNVIAGNFRYDKMNQTSFVAHSNGKLLVFQ
ncbi:uncharacterized protein A4U43_C07F2280 [Asparagus officinalis]|uniref:Protein FAR1-RELATED SEQUENCE n=1 Tax=Asparagus officinalis TaxID=4686 RepID=A0A5P1EDQ1_ASPOF|nr:uncharacterized protein A4U43_C07F2280 [Asparagus officinalis]